jgi:hypothetical protein
VVKGRGERGGKERRERRRGDQHVAAVDVSFARKGEVSVALFSGERTTTLRPEEVLSRRGGRGAGDAISTNHSAEIEKQALMD